MGVMDKAKARIGDIQQARAESSAAKAAAREADEAAEKEAAAAAAVRRNQVKEQISAACPLPLAEGEPKLPAGLELFSDEFIVTQGRDWGLSSERLVLTTQRIIKTDGRMTKHAQSCYLRDVRDVLYRKPLIGFGTIAIQTSSGTFEGIPAAKNGELLRNHLLSLVHWARSHESTTASGRSPGAAADTVTDDISGKLKQLAEMRDAGVVTPDEFEAKKADLLGRM
jgi:hypothetical protein